MKKILLVLLMSTSAFAQIGVGMALDNTFDTGHSGTSNNLVIGTRTENYGLGGRVTNFSVGLRSVENTVSTGGDYYELQLSQSLGYSYPLRDNTLGIIGLKGSYLLISNKTNYNNGNGIDENPYNVAIITGLSFSPSFYPHFELFGHLNALSMYHSGYNDNTSMTSPVANNTSVFSSGVLGIKYYM